MLHCFVKKEAGESPARTRHCIRPLRAESQTLFVNDMKL
jgi:hypothetical protein